MVCPILTAAEGFVLGMAAKMFPVAVPGEYPWPLARLRLSPTAVVYGLIYWITTLF